MWQALNTVLGQTLESMQEPRDTPTQEPDFRGSYVVSTHRFNGNAFDVVAQSEDGDTFFDIFDAMSGQCINEGCPVHEVLPAQFSQWPAPVAQMVVDFYAQAQHVQSRL